MRLALWIAIACAISALTSTGDAQQQRIRVERAADMPRHTYRVPTTANALLEDSAQFAALARQLDADLRSDLSRYEIVDRTTRQQYYMALSNLSSLRGEFGEAVIWLDSVRAIEEKPAQRMLTGIFERPYAAAHRAPPERFEDAFRDAFRRELSALPFADVRVELTSMRQYTDMARTPGSRAVTEQFVEQNVQNGALNMSGAQILVQMRVARDEKRMRLIPTIISELDRLLSANAGATKENIWPARAVSLEGRSGLTPVVIGIWDSGSDVELFSGRLFVNAKEIPGNGRDDDGNGYIDDVHGIAYDLNHDRSTGVLGPTDLSAAQQAEWVVNMRGQRDMRNGVDSPESQAFKKRMSSLAPGEATAWFQAMSSFSDYIHGTHVAGIAMDKNPVARLLVARNEEDNWKPKPQLVTMARERKRAREIRETVEYFKRNGVRVVNMSWAYTPGYFSEILAKNQFGDSISRRQLAREMFDTLSAALRTAMESAPEILFVTAAGNRNDDGRFVERVPATYDLPNLMTVAAVDYAGAEAQFTSFGKVDVHANGSEIENLVPGGATIPASGTSMAAPQVVNLAAKLLALRPRLTVAELRQIIVASADEKKVGEGKTLRVLNPKAAVERMLSARR